MIQSFGCGDSYGSHKLILDGPINVMERAVRDGQLPKCKDLQKVLLSSGYYGDQVRLRYGRKFGYGVPCEEVVEIIAQQGPLLEVGAGNGFWSFWLRKKGCDVVATDLKIESQYNKNDWINDLIRVDAVTGLRKYPDRNILMVWPHFSSTWPVDVVREMHPGGTLCYVGEGPGGCCAPLSFFLALQLNHFRIVYRQTSPAWPNVWNYLTIYKKSEASDEERTRVCLWE